MERKPSVAPGKAKAQKLVDQLRVADGSDVKKILFSLKAIFQNDR